MKNKNEITTVIIFYTTLIALLGYFFVSNSIVLINNHKLEDAINSIHSDTVNINEVVPFDWDTLYTFKPYTSKKDIEKTIGFKSINIKENNINEGMVHLLFVKGNKVVASILDYSTNLGYYLDFNSKITFTENAQFDVLTKDNVVTLRYLDK